MNQASSNMLGFVGGFVFLAGLFIVLSITIGIDCNGNPAQTIFTSIDMAFSGQCTY